MRRLSTIILAASLTAAGLSAAGLSGCAAGGDSNEVLLDSSRYARAFEATKRVLRDERFTIDRVDARAGVITTRPKSSGGLLTAWDGEQSDFGDELEDAANFQQRRVRVVFEPYDPSAPPPPTDDEIDDQPGPPVIVPESAKAATNTPPNPAGATDAQPPASPTANPGNPVTPATPATPPRKVIADPDALLFTRDLREERGSIRAVVVVYLERINRPGRQLTPKTTRYTSFSPNPLAREGGVRAVAQDEALARRLAKEIAAALEQPAASEVPTPSEPPEPQDPTPAEAPTPPPAGG